MEISLENLYVDIETYRVIFCHFICPLSEFTGKPNRALTEKGHYHYEVVPQISDHTAQAVLLQGLCTS